MKRIIVSLAFVFAMVLPEIGLAYSSNARSSKAEKDSYTNPIIHADYSDPDVIRVGEDFYMTASSFNAVPGLPILHSKDLVHWEIISHALPENTDPYFDIPQHGKGVWAPSIRYHGGLFHIYWGDPDRGIFKVTAKDPRGEWSAPVLVKRAHGNIDPSPLWDEDGKVYVVHAFAHTRAGIKNNLQVVRLSEDGSEIVDYGKVVFDGHEDHPTIEGPKFYKRNGYYYIFAPGGGVTHGWQVVLRSKNIYGPYEDRVVLAQGDTSVNGPHQGGLVELDSGESWFVHFQDKGPYGRIVHLQPVEWVNDWPVMGKDPDGDGVGEPVMAHAMPDVGLRYRERAPRESDEFEDAYLGKQWQWNANPRPQWSSLTRDKGWLQLTPVYWEAGNRNLWHAPNLLLQKLPAEAFVATAKMDVGGLRTNEEAGLVVYGMDYASLNLVREEGRVLVRQVVVEAADSDLPRETVSERALGSAEIVLLRVQVLPGATASFSYSLDGERFESLGGDFDIVQGRWVGARIGLYANRYKAVGQTGNVKVDWFRITK